MRPSAGDSTARGSSGTSRGGSRKNCRMNSASSQKGIDHQPKNEATAAATMREPKTNGHPSRAMIGCGYGGLTRYFGSSSFRRSESCPCCIALPISVVTRSTIFFGCWPRRLAASDSGTLSPQAASSNATTSSASILRSVDKTVPFYPGHHFAQPRADLLDRQLRGHAPTAEEHRRPRAVFQHELLGVLARLDAREHPAHALARVLVDDLWTGDVLAVLGVVRDRVVHGADAALVLQVDDQLEL